MEANQKFLSHVGILGMHWGHRKSQTSAAKSKKKIIPNSKLTSRQVAEKARAARVEKIISDYEKKHPKSKIREYSKQIDDDELWDIYTPKEIIDSFELGYGD